MTTTKKATAPKPAAKKTTKKPEVIKAKRARPGMKGHDERVKLSIRARWESDPKLTLNQAAIEGNVAYPTVLRWNRAEGWTKKTDFAGVSEEILAIDKKITDTVKESGLPDTPATRTRAADRVAADELKRKQEELLERHQREWAGPRRQLYEALKGKDFGGLKIAKIATEAMRNIQDGERKAFGIDKPLLPNDGDGILLVREQRSGNTYEQEE